MTAIVVDYDDDLEVEVKVNVDERTVEFTLKNGDSIKFPVEFLDPFEEAFEKAMIYVNTNLY